MALPAEVTHVGIQRLGAGDGQHDRGEGEERDVEVARQERQRRRSGDSAFKISGLSTMPVHSARADRHEPGDHHRPEEPSDGRGAVPLDGEQRQR